MILLDNLMQNLQNLRTNKLRSFLSILGLVIGVISVTVMVSLGEGLQSEVLGQLEKVTANSISVIAGKAFNPFNPSRSQDLPGFSKTDLLFFQNAMPFIEHIMPIIQMTEKLEYQGSPLEGVQLFATDERYLETEGIDILRGRWFTKKDLSNYSNVIVVGENFAETYFEGEDPLGKELLLENQYFRVIGLVEDSGGGMIPIKMAIIPVTTAQQKIVMNPYFPILSFILEDDTDTEYAVKLVKYTLLKRQGASHMDDALFQVFSSEQMMEQMNMVSSMLQLGLLGIGAIALLVGGIGVMNIMLVSVTERTREIGIRKAIGAKDRDILIQFLTESVLLSLIGCFLGVIMSRGIISVLKIAGVPALLNAKTLLVAVIFASSTGIIFGISPARKAAKMKPIDALRFE